MDHIVNNIQLSQNLTYILKAQRTYNLMVRFSKYVVILMILNKERAENMTRVIGETKKKLIPLAPHHIKPAIS